MELLRVSTILAMLLVTGAQQSHDSSETTTEQIDLTPETSKLPKECTATNGKPGLCLPETFCKEDHTIALGGDIHSSEYRDLGSSACQSLYWCCTEEDQIDTPEISTENVGSCLPSDGDICHWIVSLYKVHDSTAQSAQAAFCLGTLIGSRVVLTAGTCMAAAQRHTMYASLPFSNDPKKNYTVRYQIAHPRYNTGTHAYDFSILILEEEVIFEGEKFQGACLAFDKPKGQCVAIGIDGNERIVSTLLDVTSDVCNSFGGKATTERVCTKNADEVCLVATGSPVICESKSGRGVVVGVTRSTCVNDQVLVGSLEYIDTWITSELNKMKISKDVYLEN